MLKERKFDLRLYLVITSITPLRLYLYKEGLVRFATEKYNLNREGLNNKYIHLTNYAVNQHNPNQNKTGAEKPETKWTLATLWKYLQNKGVDTEAIWTEIQDIAVKTIFCGLENMRLNTSDNNNNNNNNDRCESCQKQDHAEDLYQTDRKSCSPSCLSDGGGGRSDCSSPGICGSCASCHYSTRNCYKLLGVDVLLDANLKPWLLEVNSFPSMFTEKIDLEVNPSMVAEMLNLVGLQPATHLFTSIKQRYADDCRTHRPAAAAASLGDSQDSENCSPCDEDRGDQHGTVPAPPQQQQEEGQRQFLANLEPENLFKIGELEDELSLVQNFENIFPSPKHMRLMSRLELAHDDDVLLDSWVKLKHTKPNS